MHQDPKKPLFLNNHVDIFIEHHQAEDEETLRIVGVYVEPKRHTIFSLQRFFFFFLLTFGNELSIEYERVLDVASLDMDICPKPRSADRPLNIANRQDNVQVAWTYSVKWIPSNTKWATRWDTYLMMKDDRIPLVLDR